MLGQKLSDEYIIQRDIILTSTNDVKLRWAKPPPSENIKYSLIGYESSVSCGLYLCCKSFLWKSTYKEANI